LPEDQALLGARGPWNEELVWRDDGTLAKRPQPRQSDTHLVSWVQEGVPAAAGLTDQFQTDGQMYLFSTLAPEPSPDGSLRLFTLDENWLHTLAFTGLLVVGLLLVRRPPAQKLAALALAIIAAVLLGVFLPIFSRQLLGGVLLAAIALVLLAWAAWHALFARPLWLTSALATAPVGASPFASPPPPDSPPAEPAPQSNAAESSQPREGEGGSHHE
jgi:hypothetical protein